MTHPTNGIITDILFDLGKVLVPFDQGIAFRRILPHLPPQQARLLTTDAVGFKDQFREPADALEQGEIDFEGFRREVGSILGCRFSSEEFRSIWCDIFVPDEEMIRLGEALSLRYGTWLVSNTSEAHYQWIVGTFPLVAFYRDAALSYRLGVMKPHAEYYRKAIALFGIDPARSVFIDDLPENVRGAARAGMHGLLFEGREKLILQLQSLGVEVPGYRSVAGEHA